MSRKYKCRKECGYESGSVQCLVHMLRKLIEESAEVMEAVALYDWRQMRIEMSDVMVVIEGLKQYHPNLCGVDKER